jgi:hypothetical protein
VNNIIEILVAMAAGYAASIFTWPRLRQTFVGIENEIEDLRNEARALERKLRG